MTGVQMIRSNSSHSLSSLLARVVCLLFSCIGLLGCSDTVGIPDRAENLPIVRTYEAYVVNDARTQLEENGDVSWIVGDKILYYCEDGGVIGAYEVEEADRKVNVPVSMSPDASYVTAVYGSSSISSHSKEELALEGVIKPVQKGTFIDGHVAIARLMDINEQTLRFQNLASFIVFSTRRNYIDHVVFSSRDNTPLHGNGLVNIHFQDDMPVASLGENGGNSIRIDLEGAGTYSIAILPTVLQKGFVLSCYDKNDELIGTATGWNPLPVQRGVITRIGSIDSHLVDANGTLLNGYGDDDDWDPTNISDGIINYEDYGDDHSWDPLGNTGADIDSSAYYDDFNWDSGHNSDGSISLEGYGDDADWEHSENNLIDIGLGWYRDDYNWDSSVNSSADLNQSGYAVDASWDSSGGQSSDMGKEGYGEDQNWNSNQGSTGQISRGGYEDGQNWDSQNDSEGSINKGNYNEDQNWH